MRKLTRRVKRHIVAGKFCALSPYGLAGMIAGVGFFCWS